MFWELIQSNKRRSILLVIGMSLVLALLGATLGAFWGAGESSTQSGKIFADRLNASLDFTNPNPPEVLPVQGYPPDYGMQRGMMSGAVGGLATALCLFLIAYFCGESLLLDSAFAREITHEMHPVLFNVVDEMRIAAGLPKPPKIYIIDEKAPNAFATGIRKEKSAVAVTVGLLTELNRDELQGVIAHEMSHIMNRDVLFMTLAASMMGSIQMISDFFMRSFRYSGSSSGSRYRNSRGGGSSAILVMAAAAIISLLCVILARIFYFAISRRREYLADACGARLSRYPEGLASALEKISGSKLRIEDANPFTSASFILNPLDAKEEGFFADLASTHPPVAERIRILRGMMNGASLEDYAKSYASIKKSSAGLLPASALDQKSAVGLRAPSSDSLPKGEVPKEVARDFGDLCAAVNGYAFFKCPCGLRFKIPPGFQDKKIWCPRCGLKSDLPFAGPIGKVAESAPADAEQGDRLNQPFNKPVPRGTVPFSYQRKQSGWESFFCSCGKMVQLSPSFSAPQVTCKFCHRKIEIFHKEASSLGAS